MQYTNRSVRNAFYVSEYMSPVNLSFFRRLETGYLAGDYTRTRNICKIRTPVAEYPEYGYTFVKYPGAGMGAGTSTTFVYSHGTYPKHDVIFPRLT